MPKLGPPLPGDLGRPILAAQGQLPQATVDPEKLEPEDVVRHLGKKEKHWKEGRSAHALVQLWSKTNGFPKAIASVLQASAAFKSAELVDAFLERQVDLRTDGRHSQTDLLAVVSLDNDIAIVAVEGKAGESFGPLVDKWLNGSKAKHARLKGLCKTLGLRCEEAKPLRYQLLHRSASAIYEAQRYRTKLAAMIVHSFSEDDEGFLDFSTFLRAVGFKDVSKGALVGPVSCDGVDMYAAWVQDKAPKGHGPNTYLDLLDNYAANLGKECKRIRTWCDKRRSKV